MDHRQWDASPVAKNMALRARFSLVRRIRSGSRSPGAVTLAEVKEALSHSAHRQQLGAVLGMTCYWQISGRRNLSFEEQVRLYLYCIENWLLSFDIKIILRIIGAVLRCEGEY